MLRPTRFAPWLRFAGALAAGIVLAGCAGPSTLPSRIPDLSLPRSVHIVEHAQGKPAQDSILIAQRESGTALRWVMLDPLGLPLARQVLEDGQWRNDGFLPPNAAARNLFSALLFAWAPEQELANIYPKDSWSQSLDAHGARKRSLQQHGQTRWVIIWRTGAPADTFSIHAADGKHWQVSPLKAPP